MITLYTLPADRLVDIENNGDQPGSACGRSGHDGGDEPSRIRSQQKITQKSTGTQVKNPQSYPISEGSKGFA